MTRVFRRTFRALSVASSVILLAAATAAAQSVSGSVSGTVIDQSNQVIPGATVTLLDELTGTSRTTQTNQTGAFVLSSVQPGRYTVRIEISGFSTFERKNINLPANERLSLGTVTMAIGALTETVTTLAEGSFVQTASSERSALITSTQLEMVAVRGRDVMSLLRVLPGVAYQGESEAPGGSFGTTSPNISGNRNSWNTVTVDGLVGNDLGSPQIFSGTVNFDAISEVKVQLNNYQAENGRNGGAMVSIVTKSGSKDYRGTGYLYKRHEKLNANDFFNNRNGIAKPLYRYTTEGATLGGPVPGGWRDKLFFFYSFENWDTQVPQPVRTVTVPTALERAGDFSQSLSQSGQLIVLRDPVTGGTFTNNQIPGGRIDANGRALLNVFPLPNALDRSITGGNYNYQFQESLEVPRHQHLARIDVRPSPKDAIYGRFSTWYADNQGFAVPAGAANWGLLGQHYTFKDASLILNYTRTLSSSLVNELSVGYRHSTEAGSALTQEGLDAVTRNHIGYTLGQFSPSINPLSIIPSASFTGAIANPAAITFEGRFPLTGADTFVTVNDTASLARGDHTFKAGFYLEHARNEEGKTGTFNGNFEFNVDSDEPVRRAPSVRERVAGIVPLLHRVVGPSGRRRNRRRGRVVRAGHLEVVAQAHAGLRIALRVVLALGAEGRCRGGVRAGTLRSEQGAAALSARAGERREAGAQPGDWRDRAGRPDWRAGARAPAIRTTASWSAPTRAIRKVSAIRRPVSRRAAARARVRPDRRRQDGDPRQRRHLPQHAGVRQRQLAGVAQPAAAVEPADLLRDDGDVAAVDRVDVPEHGAGIRPEHRDADALQLHRWRTA